MAVDRDVLPIEARDQLYELALDLLAIAGFDGRFKYVNPACTSMLGWTVEEFTALPFLDFVHPDDVSATLAQMESLGRGQATISFGNRYRHKNGSYRWLVWNCRPDTAQELIYAVAHDNTDQNEALISRSRLAAIVEGADDAILSKTPEGVITSWNPGAQRLYGYSPAEAVGQPITMLFPPDRRGEEKVILSHVLAGERLEHYETQRVHKDGEVIDVALTVSPIHGPDDMVVGASTIARDIAKQKLAERLLGEANAELRRADQIKSHFLAMASHELRTPLTAISGFTSTLLNLGEQLTVAQQREFLEIN